MLTGRLSQFNGQLKIFYLDILLRPMTIPNFRILYNVVLPPCELYDNLNPE